MAAVAGGIATAVSGRGGTAGVVGSDAGESSACPEDAPEVGVAGAAGVAGTDDAAEAAAVDGAATVDEAVGLDEAAALAAAGVRSGAVLPAPPAGAGVEGEAGRTAAVAGPVGASAPPLVAAAGRRWRGRSGRGAGWRVVRVGSSRESPGGRLSDAWWPASTVENPVSGPFPVGGSVDAPAVAPGPFGTATSADAGSVAGIPITPPPVTRR